MSTCELQGEARDALLKLYHELIDKTQGKQMTTQEEIQFLMGNIDNLVQSNGQTFSMQYESEQ